MGHHISAIITKGQVDRSITDKYDLPVFEENGFSIIALDAGHSDYWAEQLNIEFKCNRKIIPDNEVTHFFCRELGLSLYAIIVTEYFGGRGSQSAAVYKSGELILEGVKINKALRKIGVVRGILRDEFTKINLGEYRSFEDYFDKYWEP